MKTEHVVQWCEDCAKVRTRGKFLQKLTAKHPVFCRNTAHTGFSLWTLPTRKILEEDYITSYQMCHRKMYLKDSYGKVNKGAEDLRLVNLFVCGQKQF